MGPAGKARKVALLHKEMHAIHRANRFYWKQGKAQTPKAKAEYDFRNERLETIRAELAQLQSELADFDIASAVRSAVAASSDLRARAGKRQPPRH